MNRLNDPTRRRVRAEIRVRGAVLALRAVAHTIGEDRLQPVIIGAHHIHPPIDDQARQVLAHALAHDAGLAVMRAEALFVEDGGHVRGEPFHAPLEVLAAGESEVSRPGESHPEPLSEPYLNLSAHTAPAMEPRRTPICQCAHNFGSRLEIRATQCVALRKWPRSFLYFRSAHRANDRSS